MTTWSFTLLEQIERYKEVFQKLKDNNFFQDLRFYVLPFMPEKFRDRIIFFPEKCEPQKLFKKCEKRVFKLQKEWEREEKLLFKKLLKHFPEINNLDIYVYPSLYGTVGSYNTTKENKIYIYPRFDRKVVNIQGLLIAALTHYYLFNKNDEMNEADENWLEMRKKTEEIQNKIFKDVKNKSITSIIDKNYAGRLAEKSLAYLETLGFVKSKQPKVPINLTKNENVVFNLLLRSKNKMVTFEEISDEVWKEESLEKYSEYAITKLIERLKKKLPKNLIHNQRGVGYILHF